LLVLLSAILGLLSWRRLGLKVITFEKGLVRIKRGQILVVPWNDIHFVREEVVDRFIDGTQQGTSYVYEIELHDGTRVTLNNSLGDIKHLGEIVMHESSQAIYPRVMECYDQGKIVYFGSLGVSQEGLHYGRSVLHWEDIEGVQIKRGLIEVRKRGKWFNWCTIPISSVPNLYVFLALVNEIVGVQNA
jgi:hypothetical protein